MNELKRPIVVETKRCILKEMQIEDTAYWVAFTNNPKVNRFWPEEEKNVSQQEMEKVISWLVSNYSKSIAEAIRITLAIHIKLDESQPIGWVTYGPLPEDEKLKEIGYAIEPKYWGKGYATEASKSLIAWLRSISLKDKLHASVDSDNVASVRVLEKIGMKECKNLLVEPPTAQKKHQIYVLEE